MRPGFWTILLLSMISYLIVDGRVIKPDLEAKYELQQNILSGSEDSPLQYSILTPAVTFAVQKMAGVVIMNNYRIKVFSFGLVAFLSFAILYLLFYLYLRANLDESRCVLGLVMLQALIICFIQYSFHESSVFNMIFFAMGLLIIALRKDFILPLIVLTGSLNQPQIIGLVLFYMIIRFAEGRLSRPLTIITTLLSVAIWILAESFLRSFYGIRNELTEVHMLTANVPLYVISGIALLVLAVRGLPASQSIYRLSVYFVPPALLITSMLMPSLQPADFMYSFLFVIPSVLSLFSFNRPLAKDEVN